MTLDRPFIRMQSIELLFLRQFDIRSIEIILQSGQHNAIDLGEVLQMLVIKLNANYPMCEKLNGKLWSSVLIDDGRRHHILGRHFEVFQCYGKHSLVRLGFHFAIVLPQADPFVGDGVRKQFHNCTWIVRFEYANPRREHVLFELNDCDDKTID